MWDLIREETLDFTTDVGLQAGPLRFLLGCFAQLHPELSTKELVTPPMRCNLRRDPCEGALFPS